MGNLLSELRRRNIFRVAGVYAVVGWLLIQMGIALETSLDMPGWFDKLVTILVLIGFPVAMILAWAFEMTPDGVKPTESIAPEDSIAAKTGRKLDFAILGGLALVAGLAIFQISRPTAPSSTLQAASQDGQSIAVLPFVNMSSDKEQEYFADGISEEILNVLVRIPDLKVAGRTSSFSFKNKNEDLRLIGDALDVNHILEGSVRRSGTRLRITAQLIRSDDGFHLWSDTYDREVADIFDIQDEIAKEVADQLAISLGLEGHTKAQERTKDLVAYENYLKARQLFLKRGRENLDEALGLLSEATARDPEFAPAHSQIASIYSIYQSYATDEEYRANSKTWDELGKASALKALSLDPDSAEAMGALGVYYYYNFDFITAYKYFDKALELEPDNPIVLDIQAQSGLDLGYFNEGERHITKAISLDPLVPMYRNIQGWAYQLQGKREKAIASLAKAIEIDPTLPQPHWNTIGIYDSAEDVDKIPLLIERAVASGAFTPQIVERFQPIVDFVKDRETMSDEEAMDIFRQKTNTALAAFPARYFGNADEWVSDREEENWNSEFRDLPELFGNIIPGVYANERWKEQVRKDGVLALWQSRGFPAHCRPLGDNDFECDDSTEITK